MTTVQFEETMEGLVIDRISRDHDFNMPAKHFHNEYEIYYLISGDRYYFIDTETYYCPAGSLVFIECNLVHKTSMVQLPYHDRILLEIRGDILESYTTLLGISVNEFFHQYTGVYQLSLTKQQQVERLLMNIANEVKNKSPNYEVFVKLKLLELFIFIMRYDANTSTNQPTTKVRTEKYNLVEKVATYLSEYFYKNESLEEIAKKFYVNKCYLSRIFREITGFTISEYTNIYRIRKAKKLLDETNDSNSEIAEALGFRSGAYFVRVFKNHTETTPHHYRKQLQTFKDQRRERRIEKTI